MIKHISEDYALFLNLWEAARQHKEACNDSKCSVSLWQLKQVAERLLAGGDYDELRDMQYKLNTWPI